MHEALDHALFLLGLFSFACFLENGLSKQKYIFFFSLAVFFWTLGIFNFIGFILYLPLSFAFLLFSKNFNFKNASFLFLSFLFSFFFAILFLYLFLSFFTPDSQARLFDLLFNHGARNIFFDWSLLSIFRTLRNTVLILFYGYSPLFVITFPFCFFYFFKRKNLKILFFLTLSFLTLFISARFWYGGLYGRYSSFIAYPLAVLIPLLKSKNLYLLTFLVLFIVFPIFPYNYQKTPLPFLQEKMIEVVRKENSSLLLLSDYQRPQLQHLPSCVYIVNDQNQLIEDKNYPLLSVYKIKPQTSIF